MYAGQRAKQHILIVLPTNDQFQYVQIPVVQIPAVQIPAVQIHLAHRNM